MPKDKPRATADDLALLDELGVDATPEKKDKYTKLEERVIAGFEEIDRWVEEQGRLPQHGPERDIFERRYAIRLERIWESEQWRELLAPFDTSRRITVPPAEVAASGAVGDLTDAELLGVLGAAPQQGSLTELRHVRSADEIRAAEEIAKRETCEDFERFHPLFEETKRDLETGLRKTLPWSADKSVSQADWFILGGQLAYVAQVGEEFKQAYGDTDARLRVVYDNGTESNLLRRSFQKALLIDETSRRVRLPTPGPLFADSVSEEDLVTGRIYVLRSHSNQPYIAKHRKVIHKIGVTGGPVERRVANAAQDPTYLLAEVEVVAEFKLANLNRHKVELLIQRFFSGAQLNLELQDRFGKPYRPREWFLVPLAEIRKMIDLLKDGTLTEWRYDVKNMRLVPRS